MPGESRPPAPDGVGPRRDERLAPAPEVYTSDLGEDLASARRAGELLGFGYERLFVSALPRVRGALALRFYQSVYKNFSFGRRPRCWGSPVVVMARESSIVIGDDLWAVSDNRRANIALHSPCKLRTMRGAQIRIGDRVALNGTSITCQQQVEIGSGSLIAANVIILDSDFHQLWPPESRWLTPDKGQPVTIGTNVWIGMGSLVLKGSSIGDNSIIGAGSVVTGAIPRNVMAAGHPAKVLRHLGG